MKSALQRHAAGEAIETICQDFGIPVADAPSQPDPGPTTPSQPESQIPRIISGIIMHAAAVLMLLAPAWIWAILVLAATVRLNVEFASLARGRGYTFGHGWALISGIGLVVTAAAAGFLQVVGDIGRVVPDLLHLQTTVLALSCVITLILALRLRPQPVTIADVAVCILAIVYVGWLPSFFLSLRLMPSGTWLMAWIVGGAVMSDNFAWLCGRLFGRHPFFAHISPRKTIEGATGSLVITTALLALTAPLVGIPTVHGLVLGALIAAAAQAGDLVESLIKRDANVKDAAALIPGHGGLLDRLDSCLLAGAVAYTYLSALGAG